MAPTVLYTACVLGALGLYALLRGGRAASAKGRTIRMVGALLAVGAFGALVVAAAEAIAPDDPTGRPEAFYLLFSFIALASAVKMITNTRPVYAALYFVLVVLASAGLFLLLEAEFMAFALIIVYAGAILITYMFVLMLAQQGPAPDDEEGQPEYDLVARDPLQGVVVGFILLALLSRMIIDGIGGLPAPPTPQQVRVNAWRILEEMPGRLEEMVDAEVDEPFALVEPADEYAAPLAIAPDARTASLRYRTDDGVVHTLVLTEAAMPENVQLVGMALIAKFPVSLELAGVILLMAMLGAVILARRQIELTEDEKREAAGLRRLGHHDEPREAGEVGT